MLRKFQRARPSVPGAERQVPIVVALSGSPIREIRGKKDPPLPAADYSPVAAPLPHEFPGE